MGNLFAGTPPEPEKGPLATWAPKGAPNKEGNCIQKAYADATARSLKKAPWPPRLQKGFPIRMGIVLEEPFRKRPPGASKGSLVT